MSVTLLFTDILETKPGAPFNNIVLFKFCYLCFNFNLNIKMCAISNTILLYRPLVELNSRCGCSALLNVIMHSI